MSQHEPTQQPPAQPQRIEGTQTTTLVPAPGDTTLVNPDCITCGKSAKFYCAYCREATYCSEQCQTVDWPHHQHMCAGAIQLAQQSDQEAAAARRGPQDPNAADTTAANNTPARNLDDPEELKFYMEQIYHIVKPVLCCILLSILWVKISLMGSDYRPTSSYSVYQQQDGDTADEIFAGSLKNALIIMAEVVGMTILFVILFKYGCYKILFGFIFLVVAMVLGFMGFLLVLNLVQVFAIPLDFITLIFGLYNFAMVGNIVVFWRGPLWIQQSYLVLLSSLMAFSLTGLESWTTWLLLGILAIWDLIAVLCPFGPLKLLVESSRDQGRDIPALLYSVTMVYQTKGESAEESSVMGETAVPMRVLQLSDALDPSSAPGDVQSALGRDAATSRAQLITVPSSEGLPPALSDQPPTAETDGAQAVNTTDAEQQEAEEDDERNGLKLGLGDFVFYSVLIARAAMNDWITTVVVTVSVLTGLNMTIFLLAVYRKALPALPISIAFGLLFYFISSVTLVPFTLRLNMAGVVL